MITVSPPPSPDVGHAARLARRLGAALVLVGAVATPALAQTADCTRLRAAIRNSESDTAQGDGRTFDRAVRQQRGEIDRTQRYADQIGCGRQAGLFDDGPPPECSDIETRLQRMQDNLDRMQSRAATPSAPDRGAQQAALIARYNASCTGAPSNPADLAQDQGFGFAPDDGRNPADLRTVPLDPDLSTVPLDGDIMDAPGDRSRNAGEAICVRSCDGGYFPLAPRADQDRLDGLDDLCRASCPNTEAHLYTMGSGGDLTSATAIDGTSYTALPTAFRFEKSFTATCTCKPPNQSWVQALAPAEKLLGSEDRHDVTVTASMSDQMAKPAAMVPPKGKSRTKAAAASPPAADPSAAKEALRAGQAPTATHDSAGIGGVVEADKTVRQGDGPTVAVAGPGGVTKRIRLIVP